MPRSSSLDLFRFSSNRWANPAKVEPHPPVASPAPSTCATCSCLIGWTEELDPVHWVERPCVKCKKLIAPPSSMCDICTTNLSIARQREREERLQGYRSAPATEPEAAVVEEPSDDPTSGGFNPKYAEAKAYASTYSGTFDFMLSMKDRVNGPRGVRGKLSEKMVEAILKCKAAAERNAEPKPAVVGTGRDLTSLPEGRTGYAVENESGVLTFLLIDVVSKTATKLMSHEPSPWRGWVFVKQQQGPNEVRLGSQRPGSTYVGQWPSLIDKVLADPVAAAARYGIELGVCGICMRPLTNDESRRDGIGPVCKARLEATAA